MPKSKVRVKKDEVYTPPPQRPARRRRSAQWVGPVALALLLVGMAYLVVYYITAGSLTGMDALGSWNLAIGFAFIIGGFGLLTQWR